MVEALPKLSAPCRFGDPCQSSCGAPCHVGMRLPRMNALFKTNARVTKPIETNRNQMRRRRFAVKKVYDCCIVSLTSPSIVSPETLETILKIQNIHLCMSTKMYQNLCRTLHYFIVSIYKKPTFTFYSLHNRRCIQ